MKNNLKDLNNYLFGQLERLEDEELSNNNFDKEIKRSKAISTLAQQIVNISNTQIQALKLMSEYGISKEEIPKQITLSDEK